MERAPHAKATKIEATTPRWHLSSSVQHCRPPHSGSQSKRASSAIRRFRSGPSPLHLLFAPRPSSAPPGRAVCPGGGCCNAVRALARTQRIAPHARELASWRDRARMTRGSFAPAAARRGARASCRLVRRGSRWAALGACSRACMLFPGAWSADNALPTAGGSGGRARFLLLCSSAHAPSLDGCPASGAVAGAVWCGAACGARARAAAVAARPSVFSVLHSLSSCRRLLLAPACRSDSARCAAGAACSLDPRRAHSGAASPTPALPRFPPARPAATLGKLLVGRAPGATADRSVWAAWPAPSCR
jgi:hypothetical protein